MKKRHYIRPEIDLIIVKLEFDTLNNAVLHSKNEPGNSTGGMSGGGNNGGGGSSSDIGDDIWG